MMIDGVIDKAETTMITIGNLQEWTINQGSNSSSNSKQRKHAMLG